MQTNFTQKLQAMAQQPTEAEVDVQIPKITDHPAAEPQEKQEGEDAEEKVVHKKKSSSEHVRNAGQP